MTLQARESVTQLYHFLRHLLEVRRMLAGAASRLSRKPYFELAPASHA